MRHQRRAAVLATAALLASPVVAHATTTSVPSLFDTAPTMQPWLERHLTEVAPTTTLRVMVRGTSDAAAARAVEAAGMRVQQRWPLLDIAVAVGPAAQVSGLLSQDDVLRVEGDTPLDFHLETSHEATRSDEAAASFPGKDGSGVSIAVIDSGIDGTHPFFQQDGATKVVQNRKNACGIDFEIDPLVSETCFVSAPDTDTVSGGGHGTHVAGIAAGVPVSVEGNELRGSASGAKLVGLSVGAAIGLLDAVAAQNWVLEHMQNPCRSAAAQSTTEVDAECPPIRVTNHSYGPAANTGEDNVFSEDSFAVVAQRAFVARGGVAVWAAGNDGGDGTFAFTNPDAMDPTPGVIMVASYDDAQTGSRDNALSTFSSRGRDGATGTYPDLAAPGDLITSSCRAYLPVCATGFDVIDGGNYNTISGTSMASPYVAGVVAQLMQANPDLTPAQIEDVLEDTAHEFEAGAAYEADPRNDGGLTSFDKGHGLVDVVEALAVATGVTAPEAPSPAVCPVDAAYSDPTGDATNLLGTPGVTPNDPALDVTGGSLRTTAEGVELTVTLDDLVAGPNGQIVEQTFNVRGTAYYAFAQRATGDGTVSFEYGDMGSATGGRRLLGTTTGAFDDAADTVSIVFPRTAVTPVLADGELLGGLTVTTRRDAVLVIPDADTATGGCAYRVGATATEPTDPTGTPSPTATASPTGTPSPEPTGTASPTPTGTASTEPSPTCEPKGNGNGKGGCKK